MQGLSGIADVAETLGLAFGFAAMDHGLICDRRTLIRGDGRFCPGCRPLKECFSCKLHHTRMRDKVLAHVGRYLPSICASAISDGASGLLGRPLGKQLTWWDRELEVNARLTRAVARLDAFVTATSWHMELARKRLPAGVASQVLMYPLPKELRSPEPKAVPVDTLRVGFVGRPIPIKGLHVLVEAVERARTQIPVELRMFCPRNDEEAAEYWWPLRNRVRGLAGSVWTECGVLDHASLRAIHRTIDVLAVPSTWPEYVGFVTLEAQALGTPVLLSDFPPQRELFAEDRRSGWFVAPADVDAWVACLISVWEAKCRGELRTPICRAPSVEEYAKCCLRRISEQERTEI